MGIIQNRNHGPQIARIKTATGSSDKDHDKNRDGEHDKSRKGDIQTWFRLIPADALHDAETTMMSAAVTNKHRRSCRHDSSFDDCRAKQWRRTSTSLPHGRRWVHTPERQPLPPPPMLHSTPLGASLKPTSVESVPARLSFDCSQCSLPPLELGEEDAHSLPSMGIPIQAATPSVAGPIPLLSRSASTLNLTADHTKIIFNLACEGLHLKEQVTREFVRSLQ